MLPRCRNVAASCCCSARRRGSGVLVRDAAADEVAVRAGVGGLTTRTLRSPVTANDIHRCHHGIGLTAALEKMVAGAAVASCTVAGAAEDVGAGMGTTVVVVRRLSCVDCARFRAWSTSVATAIMAARAAPATGGQKLLPPLHTHGAELTR